MMSSNLLSKRAMLPAAGLASAVAVAVAMLTPIAAHAAYKYSPTYVSYSKCNSERLVYQRNGLNPQGCTSIGNYWHFRYGSPDIIS